MSKREVLKGVLRYIGAYRFSVAASVILALINVVLVLYIPILTGEAVDCMIAEGSVDMEQIFSILWKIGAAAVCAGLSSYLMNLANNRIAYGVAASMRKDVFAKLTSLPVGYIDSHPHGDIVSLIVSDIDTIADGLLMGASSLFTGIMTILGTLIFMFIVSIPIAVTVVVVTPVSLLVARFIARRSYDGFAAQAKDRAAQTQVIEEMIDNIKAVQVFLMEEEMQRKFDETADELKKDSLRAVFFSSITNPATRFVNAIVYAAVGVFGALYAVSGGISVGMLSCFLTYANQYTKPFNEISGVVTELQNAIACAGRVFEILERDGRNNNNDIVMTETNGRVVFDEVCFSYDKNDDLIRGFSLRVEPGERVAIVGPTGAGKSTIINLLMRFYEVDSGRILISDKDISKVDPVSLRSCIGMVLQETWLPSGTIRDIIAYGKPEASDEEVMAAAESAHADSFIRRLPDKYETYIGEDGGSLSEGQKQLLCIARVMMTLPPMLILDEATSSIDTRTEMKIQKAFASMMEGRTSFIVAHRLQTIREADIIIVMDGGKVVEQGTHLELLKKNGFYSELYKASRA